MSDHSPTLDQPRPRAWSRVIGRTARIGRSWGPRHAMRILVPAVALFWCGLGLLVWWLA